MVKNLLNQDSASRKPKDNLGRKEEYKSNYYFDNEIVERLLYRYLEGACTSQRLRDEIMTHASELIRQVIKAHNLGQIYPGRDESSIGDLFQVAWIQIESALYKYEALPHCASCYNKLRPNDSLICNEFVFATELVKRINVCPKCKTRLQPPVYGDNNIIISGNVYYRGKSRLFNLWSQISRTVILAHIKKENRDRKNSPVFREHLENRVIQKQHVLYRFIEEAKEIFKYNSDGAKLLVAIQQLYLEDDRSHEGLIGKLVERSGLPRQTVTSFLRMIRLRSHEFTDSPVNESNETLKKYIVDAKSQEND